METPEKIYLWESELCGRDYDDEWFDQPLNGDSVEYTRTDVVIEKAVEYIANNMRCDGYTLQTKAKFIKEFRNYLKGDR